MFNFTIETIKMLVYLVKVHIFITILGKIDAVSKPPFDYT